MVREIVWKMIYFISGQVNSRLMFDFYSLKTVFCRYFQFHTTVAKKKKNKQFLCKIKHIVQPKLCCKVFENRLTIKNFLPKNNLNRDFSLQNIMEGR